ncbi:MAG TPA: tetratricopeptide repeat protein, partial [Chitinophagales bacterium]|nr:tetratricopeptide repeat protein [Chitinophagales bacterium]
KARISQQQEKYDEAESCLQKAIEINPQDGDYFALWASIKLTRKQFEQALELAEKSLELDPENIHGLNARSTALLKLNKKEAAFTTIEGALAEDPNNPYTHANYGWSLLEKGDHKKALVHFKEALKNDPNLPFAQSGMLEALKAKYLFYRLFLKYAFWISNLTAKYQWGVIIGFYVGFRIIREIAERNQMLQPYLIPLIVLLAFVAFSTWVINPLSNLFLRLNPYGKYLLDKREIISSNFVGFSFLLFVLGVLSYFVFGEEKWLTIAAFGFAMMVPFGVMFSPSKYKHSLLIYAAVMFFIGTASITTTFISGELFNMFTTVFLFAFIAFQWIANYLMIRQSNV